MNATADDFGVPEVWKRTAITAGDEVLLSFDAMQTVLQMRRVDVERWFDYIWYPTSDDLYLFDSTMSWLLYVHHDGHLYVVRRDERGEPPH